MKVCLDKNKVTLHFAEIKTTVFTGTIGYELKSRPSYHLVFFSSLSARQMILA
jgi:hypothetical protein